MTLRERRMHDIYMSCREQILCCIDCLEVIQNNYKNNRISGGCCQRKGIKLLKRIEQLRRRFELTPHELPSSTIECINEMKAFLGLKG